MQSNEHSPEISPILIASEAQQLIGIMDYLPDVLFWIKDCQGHFVYVNKHFYESKNCKRREDVIGKSDFDYAPQALAKKFLEDDRKVLDGQVVIDRLEMNVNDEGGVGWYLTTKKPIYDKDNNVLGTFGICRNMKQTAKTMSVFDSIKVPVEFIRENYAKNITIEDVAQKSFLSVSALERRFRKAIKKTPKQFLNEVRLENARRLLIETNIPLSTIANEVGFGDHSYFSKQFKSFFGQLPSEARAESIDLKMK